MAPAPHAPCSLLRLYAEEVRALPRGRFALAGAATLLALLALLAAGPAVSAVGGLWGFGFVAYVVVPTGFGALVAARVAGARASLFVHGVFTMPVTKGRYLAALVLASLTLGAAYLVATLPFVAVLAAHLASPSLALRFLAVGAGLLAFATALGTLLGILVTGRGVAAATSVAAGVALMAFLAVPFLASVLADAPAQAGDLALRAAHLSPVVLLMGAAGLLPFGQVPASPANAIFAFALPTLGLVALAAWAYLREQGVEAWETTTPRRALVALALAALVLAPAALADAAYEPGGERLSGALGSSKSSLDAALVAPGLDARSALYGDRAPPLRVGETQPRELVVAFPTAQFSDLTDVRILLDADPRLRIEGPTEVRLDALPTQEVLEFPARPEPFPMPAFTISVLRIPLNVTALAPDALARNVYVVHVNATFTATPREDAPPEATPLAGARRGSATFPVLADVPGASLQMGLAGAPFLLACAAGAALRRHRTR